MSIESAIKAIHAAGLSDTQSEQFLSNDHLRRIVEVVLNENSGTTLERPKPPNIRIQCSHFFKKSGCPGCYEGVREGFEPFRK